MEENHVVELLPAYSLDALEPAEATAVEAHLRNCEECQNELESYRMIAGDLALAVAPRRPAADLRERIIQKTTEGEATAHLNTFKVDFEAVKNWFSRLTLAWGVVSLVLLIFLAVNNLNLRQQLQQPPVVGEFYVVAMSATDRAPEASGVLVISGDGMDGTLVVEHLPHLEKVNQYQLWLIQNGQRISGGVFSLEEDGYGYLVVTSPASLLSYDSFGVTIEPYGGSPGPTGDKVMGGEL